MEQFAYFIIKSSIFFSDSILKNGTSLFAVGMNIFLFICLCATTQIFSTIVCHNRRKEKFNKYIIPSIILTLIVNILFSMMIILIGIQFNIIGLLLISVSYAFSGMVMSCDKEVPSALNITYSITSFFIKLQKREETIKKYKENYFNSIKQSEKLWKLL